MNSGKSRGADEIAAPRLFFVQERRCRRVTMLMCDNDRCRYNNDRVCARAKIYCVGRRCMSAKRYGVIDLMRKPDWAPKERDRNYGR